MKVCVASVLISLSTRAFAQDNALGIYHLATTIPWSLKPPSSVDQGVVYNDTYYLSDRTNAGVHVVSLLNNNQTALITGFITTIVNGSVLNTASGPDGLILLPDRSELWAGDGNGTVRVISLLSNTIVANISTGSENRADEFAYDSKNGIVVVTNADETIPYVTVMSAANRTVLGKIMFTGAAGLEQPAFNVANGVFYVSVPETETNPGGAICTLDLAHMSIAATYPLPDCNPAGIVFGPRQSLFIGCSQDQIANYNYSASYVMDATNGSIIANVSGIAGIDQVAYDPTRNLYYASAYRDRANGSANGEPTPRVAIVNASSNSLIQTIITDNVTAHSVAVDVRTGAMIVPVRSRGILVYSYISYAGGFNASATVSGNPAVATYSGRGAGRAIVDLSTLTIAAMFAASVVF